MGPAGLETLSVLCHHHIQGVTALDTVATQALQACLQPTRPAEVDESIGHGAGFSPGLREKEEEVIAPQVPNGLQPLQGSVLLSYRIREVPDHQRRGLLSLDIAMLLFLRLGGYRVWCLPAGGHTNIKPKSHKKPACARNTTTKSLGSSPPDMPKPQTSKVQPLGGQAAASKSSEEMLCRACLSK